jgi:hypothetical protein
MGSSTTSTASMRPSNPSGSTTGGASRPPVRSERELELHNEWTREMERAVGGAQDMLARGMENLGDDELMMLVGQYTRQIDIDIRQHMIGMRSRANQSRNYNAVMEEVLRQVGNTSNRNNEPLNLDARIPIVNERGETEHLPLRDVMRSLGIRTGENPKLTTEVVEAIKTAVNKNVEGIRAQSEQGQLELQQIMSRRSQMLQITSNIFASRNESRKSIAQNIR